MNIYIYIEREREREREREIKLEKWVGKEYRMTIRVRKKQTGLGFNESEKRLVFNVGKMLFFIFIRPKE